jgi:hypothetical protein
MLFAMLASASDYLYTCVYCIFFFLKMFSNDPKLAYIVNTVDSSTKVSTVH